MNCVHCGYKHGYCQIDGGEVWETEKVVGEYGDFWRLPINMERGGGGYYITKDERDLYGCPSCDKVFMN